MKISRRDFLKYCASSAAVLGLDATALAKLETALAANAGPHVLWLSASSCTGCTVSLANLISPGAPRDVADLLINVINLDYHPNLMGAAGDLAVQTLRAAQAGNYILAVEGGIPSAFGGHACTLWHENGAEVTALDAVRDMAGRSIANLAIGTCAAYGGIPKAAPNPTQVASLGSAIAKPTINIPGCPPHPDWIVYVIAQLLAGNTPPLDASGRPRALFGRKVHDLCPRKESGEAKTFGVAGLCLKEVGCDGPETWADCPSRLWNNRASTCINANANCIGCTESDFAARSFYRVATTSTIPAQRPLAVSSATWDAARRILSAAGAGKIGSQAVVKDRAGILVAAAMIARDGTWAISKADLPSAPASVVVSSDGLSVTADVVSAPTTKPFALTSAQYTSSTNLLVVAGTGKPGSLVTVSSAEGAALGTATILASGTWSLTASSPAPVPRSVNAQCDGVSLTTAVTGIPAAAAFAVLKAEYDAIKRSLRVEGKGLAGAKVTVNFLSGGLVGRATVTSDGKWRVTAAGLGQAPSAITATSGGVTLAAPVTIKNAAMLSVTKAEYSAFRRELKVEGAGTAGVKVTVKSPSGSAYGAAIVTSDGKWRIVTKGLSSAPPTVTVTAGPTTLTVRVVLKD